MGELCPVGIMYGVDFVSMHTIKRDQAGEDCRNAVYDHPCQGMTSMSTLSSTHTMHGERMQVLLGMIIHLIVCIHG